MFSLLINFDGQLTRLSVNLALESSGSEMSAKTFGPYLHCSFLMVPRVLSDRVFFPSLFLMEPLGKPAFSSNLPTVLSLLTCRVMLLPPFSIIFIMLIHLSWKIFTILFSIASKARQSGK